MRHSLRGLEKVAEAVWTAFHENEIEIPFPRQVQYNLFGTPSNPQDTPEKPAENKEKS